MNEPLLLKRANIIPASASCQQLFRNGERCHDEALPDLSGVMALLT